MNWAELFFVNIVFICWSLCIKLWDVAFDVQNVEDGIIPWIIGGICYIMGYNIMVKYGKLVRDKKINS